MSIIRCIAIFTLVNYVMQAAGSYKDNNRVRLIKDGREYFDLLEKLILRARDSIYIQIYIFDDDVTGTRVAEALKQAVIKNGVKVYFLVDGFGAGPIRSSFIRSLQDSGVGFRWFRPVLSTKRFYFGRRLHNKVVVIDSVYALVGGRNISDKYNDLPGHPAWLDMSVYIEGETAYELEKVCVRMWDNIFSTQLPVTLTAEHVFEERLKGLNITTPCKIRVRRNDRLKLKAEIEQSYLSLFKTAKKEIVVMGSYFLPGRNIRKQMEKATERGVDIRVVVTGVSDVWLAKYAERYLYRWMLRNNIRVYEYIRNVLHAKAALRDAEWMTIGSFNVNNISAHVSVELNVDIDDSTFVQHVQGELEEIITRDCVQVSERGNAVYFSMWSRAIERIAYETVRLLLYLVTFYYKRPRLPEDEAGEYSY